jgi:hypothetical protein
VTSWTFDHGLPQSWVNELEDILEENVPIKLEFIRNDILKDVGPLGLIIHTKLNRLTSSGISESSR